MRIVMVCDMLLYDTLWIHAIENIDKRFAGKDMQLKDVFVTNFIRDRGDAFRLILIILFWEMNISLTLSFFLFIFQMFSY